MGLDTTHGCWHGAYSAFTRWRNTIALAAGYKLVKLDPQNPWYECPDINWDAVTEENLYGVWERVPEDPLILLIAHSDCDGEIRVRDAGPLADRLEELLPKVSSLEDDGGHIGNWAKKTQAFIDGLRLAVEKNESVEFH